MNGPEIKALPKELADMIAAGEVVERPLSIVKELVENSLDAGSTSVTVEISKGGKEYIRVTDNGCGIEKAQIGLAFMRYATSKLRTESDLSAIRTLGFRGEALASIAAVSRTELISRPAGQKMGARVRIEGSEILETEDAACEEGTTIIVRDLFYNVPARLKFLKPDNTESSLITDYVSKMAIAYPGVRIRLISNGTILFSTPGKNSLYQAILTVFSPKMTQSLLSLASDNGSMQIKGYISSPTYSEKNRRKQIFFVNGRLIKSRLLDQAVADAYSDKLFEGQYPAVFLFLSVDPSSIDVNIHPNKTEIRFFEERPVSDFVIRAIRSCLLDPKALEVRTEKEPKEPQLTYPEEQEEDTATGYDEALTESVSFAESIQNDTDRTDSLEPVIIRTLGEERTSPLNSYFKELREEETRSQGVQEEIFEYNVSKRLKFSDLEYVGDFLNTYLILKDQDGLYLIDQHAAHERVMYEKLLKSFNGDQNAAQQLLVPFVLELDAVSVLAAGEAVVMLESLGFEMREFGTSSFAVSAVPEFMDLSEAEDFLEEFFAAASENCFNLQAKKEAITMRSCKSAVKAHDRLSYEEVIKLLAELDKCENPYSCPHGRPTFMKFTEYELEKLFKRK